jgi:hypothetical protein
LATEVSGADRQSIGNSDRFRHACQPVPAPVRVTEEVTIRADFRSPPPQSRRTLPFTSMAAAIGPAMLELRLGKCYF